MKFVVLSHCCTSPDYFCSPAHGAEALGLDLHGVENSDVIMSRAAWTGKASPYTLCTSVIGDVGDGAVLWIL